MAQDRIVKLLEIVNNRREDIKADPGRDPTGCKLRKREEEEENEEESGG